MTRLPLPQLLDTLPHKDGPLHLELEPDPNFHLRTSELPGYVSPDVFNLPPSSDSPVLLLDAPGAMGKTAFAHTAAHRLNAPLFDLSGVAVGSDSLTGTLTRNLGWTLAAEFTQDLRAGRSALLVDGLDEAQLLAGRESFHAFLRNVAELAIGAQDSWQIILCGRPDSIETTQLILESMGIFPTSGSLAPLTLRQATQLIDLALDLRGDGDFDVHRRHPEPFAALRDFVLQTIAKALGAPADSVEYTWPAVEDFLGYPPVIMAIAERLAVGNPTVELQSLGASSGDALERGHLLERIVERILDREANKVRGNLQQALDLSQKDERIEVLYTREEQVLRALAHKSRLNIDIQAPATLTSTERHKYEQQLNLFIPDHPLLAGRQWANIVFGDYVRAFVATAPTSTLHGVSHSELLEACGQLGPFFVYFVHGLSSTPGQLLGESHERIVDDLVRSFFAGSGLQGTVSFLDGGPDGAFLILMEADPSGHFDEQGNKGKRAVFFWIPAETGILQLSGPLGRTVVSTNQAVVLSTAGAELRLGPDCFVVASELEIRAKHVIGVANFENSVGTILVATEQADVRAVEQVSGVPGEAALRVNWPNIAYPWRTYYMESPQDLTGGPEALRREWTLLTALRRILVTFQRQADRVPSTYFEKLEQRVVGQDSASSVALQALLQLGCVYREGVWYRLDLENLKGLGISYPSLSGPEFQKTLSPLLEEAKNFEFVRDFLGL